jgi:hypothetical protein
MLSKTRGKPVHSSAPGAIPDAITDPVSNGASAVADADRAQAQASAAPGQSYPARGSAATERDERRHQRAVARQGNGRDGANTAERLQPATAQPTGPSRRGRLVIGETVSVGLIGIIVVGLIAGAILGALGASGWVVGLLVATLTVILSAVLRRSARQR